MMKKLGFPEPEVQFVLRSTDGSVIRFDFAWPDVKIALEIDHSFWHAGSAESRKDKGRDRRAALLGWHTLRLTEDDVNLSLEKVLAEVLLILRTERAKLGK
jgi:very-short-patch-repair endonuclease